MSDWIIAGFVYLPAYFAAHWIGDHGYLDPVMAGWIASALAMWLRYEGPSWIRWKRA